MAHQKDILSYVRDVIQDTRYNYPKFIPISLPRRLGKTTIANNLKQLYPIPHLKVIDNFEKVSHDQFFQNLLPWFRPKNNILVVLFTVQDDEAFSTQINNHYPCILGNFVNENTLKVTYPNGKECNYNMVHDIHYLSQQKEAEISDIMKLFDTQLSEELNSKLKLQHGNGR